MVFVFSLPFVLFSGRLSLFTYRLSGIGSIIAAVVRVFGRKRERREGLSEPVFAPMAYLCAGGLVHWKSNLGFELHFRAGLLSWSLFTRPEL